MFEMTDILYNSKMAARLVTLNGFNEEEALKSFVESDYYHWYKHNLYGHLYKCPLQLVSIFTNNVTKTKESKCVITDFASIVIAYMYLVDHTGKTLKEIAEMFPYGDMQKYARQDYAGGAYAVAKKMIEDHNLQEVTDNVAV